MILSKSLLFKRFLEKIIQFGWLRIPTNSSSLISTNSSPLQFFKLGSNYIKDYKCSWIKIILNKICVLRIILMIKLFLWIFCKIFLMFFKIMLECHSQLNESIVFCYFRVLNTFLSAIPCWNNTSRKNIDLNQLQIFEHIRI